MGERWDFYFCTVDDQPASVFVNLALEGDAPLADLSYVGSARIRMKNPRPDGLSSADEAATLNHIENTLNAEARRRDATIAFVGRNTSGGNRDLFFYMSSPDWWVSLIAATAKLSAYEIEADVWEDRLWETYLEFLLPNVEQRETIQNRHVCEQLEQRGDPLDTPREIDHWIYFPEPDQRAQFQMKVAGEAFQTRSLIDEPSRSARYGLQIYRVDLPSYNTIDRITLPLFRLARELGGEYDGWETAVEKRS
jgi:hypothetical protein